MEAGGGTEVPMLLFLDYIAPPLNRYYALPLQGRKDYFRLFGAEAYALGIMFAFPLAVTSDGNTATVLGMMDFFKQLQTYYKRHGNLYLGTQELVDVPTVSAPNVTTVLSKASDGSIVLHLINHNYAAGTIVQHDVTASFPLAAPPTSVKLVSPDFAMDKTASFTYTAGTVTVAVGDVDAYVAVVVE
jgi:hypothetical protein